MVTRQSKLSGSIVAEAWYLLAQQKELLVTPLDPDDVLPMQPALPGEHSRTLVGDATAVGRAAQLYEVQTDRHGRVGTVVRMG